MPRGLRKESLGSYSTRYVDWDSGRVDITFEDREELLLILASAVRDADSRLSQLYGPDKNKVMAMRVRCMNLAESLRNPTSPRAE